MTNRFLVPYPLSPVPYPLPMLSDSHLQPLDASASLATVLAAWNDATVRLEQTHEALREEVKRLTDELEIKNRELARKNRLADLGQMASHVAHEVRNNLVPVTLYLSLLRRRISGDVESLSILDKISAGFTALDATVNDLLHFASDRDPHWRTFAFRRLAEELCAALAPQFEAQGIHPVLEILPSLQLTADREMIRRAVLNLLLNAMDAMPDGGKLLIAAAEDAKGVSLQVADGGPGLSADARRRAFEPFFSTKPGGTGLGLSIVYRTAEVHGGRVSAENRPQGGACFTIHLPRATPQEAAA
jgi:signal transduction histidine kinase